MFVVTTRRRGVALTPMETRHDVIVQAAQLADELGYEVFAVPEGWGFDSTLLLTELAMRTRRITLVSAILSVWGRTPATLAMTAATLYRLAKGRYVLGLGTSTRALVEGFHDLAFERPADKLREVTTKVRALLAGERALLDDPAAARPLRLGLPPVPELPIWLAAMGERTSRVAAELGDGWIPIFVSRDHLAGRVAELDRARRAAGLRPEPLTVAAGPWTVAATDAGAARDVAASCVAWYLSAMGDVYGRTLADQGYGAAVEAVRAANPRPRPQDGTVPAEAQVLLDEFTASGTPAQVREQLERWDGVADVTMVGLPPGLPWDAVEATLRAAAPAPSAVPVRRPTRRWPAA
jgi:alkanesulfonate monooxygenase SsuD/methylene tetrahydromethanopterin reductase-like flavin-dependent oxidoreductase (luciferase family)